MREISFAPEAPNTEIEELGNKIHSDSKKGINKGLKFFNRIPDNVQGEDLFLHHIKFRELHVQEDKQFPSPFLDLEITKENKKVLVHTRQILCGKNLPSKREIFADAYRTGATKKLARRKIDAMGRFKPHCAMVNDEKAMRCFENYMQMSASIAEISKNDKEHKKQKLESLIFEYQNLYRVAVEKLTKFQNATKITKKEICAILHVRCNEFVDVNKSINTKPKLVDRLLEIFCSNPTLMGGRIGTNGSRKISKTNSIGQKNNTEDIDPESVMHISTD